MSVYVSGIKNKMGFINYSTNTLSDLPYDINKIDPKFLFWFSGFTDGEGNFLISLDRQYVKLRFKINLHIDDIKVLETIRFNLNTGRVISETDTSCSYIVENYSGLELLCNIFKKFPLHTAKKLDFEDFHQAFLIRKKGKVSDKDLKKIENLKSNMNSNRKVFSYDLTNSQIMIDPNWFIGFIEGEGTFGIKTGSSLYFQVAQKNTSQECLNGIVAFLHNLFNNTNVPPYSKISPLHVTYTTNTKTDVVSIVISSADSLFYFLLPLLENSKMYSRKKIDFELWRIALLLKIKGYYYTIEGKILFLDISDTLNKRYSTKTTSDVDKVIASLFERFETILKKDPMFDVNLYERHTENVRKFNKLNNLKHPKVVYIYEDNKLIDGSPFSSFSLAHKALGLNPSSNTCNRYIDTNRLYKNKYIFTSRPIDSASKA